MSTGAKQPAPAPGTAPAPISIPLDPDLKALYNHPANTFNFAHKSLLVMTQMLRNQVAGAALVHKEPKPPVEAKPEEVQPAEPPKAA